MNLSNQVMEMKMQGLDDFQIVNKLKEQGVSPFQINQTMEQLKIKEAVSNQESEFSHPDNEFKNQREMDFPVPEGMQPSVVETEHTEEQSYPPQSYRQQENIQDQYIPQDNSLPQDQYAPQQYYSEQEEGSMPQYQTSSSETMSEIAEYIFEERMSKIRKKLSEFENFKVDYNKNIEIIDSRLKKVETFLEEVQLKILGKIGNYGENLENIKKEMEMMQNSFNKVLTPITEKLKKIKTNKQKAKRTKR